MSDDKKVTIVAAIARNRAIGLHGRMPWHLPAELKHFKRVTLGKPVVMGRKTWEAIGHALPGRQNIVITRNRDFRAAGAQSAASLEQALELAKGEEVMVIGGGQLYRAAMQRATRMVLTVVDCEPDGDTWFPQWREGEWRLLRSESFAADERNPHAWEIREFQRVSAAAP